MKTSEAAEKFYTIAVALRTDSDAVRISDIFNWLHNVFMEAHKKGAGSIFLTATI